MATIVSLPSIARAESAFLLGFSFGGALDATSQAHLHLRAGTGLDWLHESGLVLTSRLELSESIDPIGSLAAGWWGPGIVSGSGLQLGLVAGGAARVELDGRASAGPRAGIALGLWYARALLELDATLLEPLADRRDAELLFGLTLRFVPWAPWRVGE